MDTTLLAIGKETVHKELKLMRKWQAEAEKKEAISSPAPASRPLIKRVSSAINFLDQTLGLCENPYEQPKRASSPALLSFGVSAEGQGKAAYLKQRTLKAPQTKYGRVVA